MDLCEKNSTICSYQVIFLIIYWFVRNSSRDCNINKLIMIRFAKLIEKGFKINKIKWNNNNFF